jgi:hypothetical protein
MDESYATPVASRGRCGAIITATYSPVHGINGWAATDPNYGSKYPAPKTLDCVDPELTPVIKSTQLGRDLSVYAPAFGMSGAQPSLIGGVSDCASVPEMLYELSFRRLLVPFIPTNTFSQLVNRVNQYPISIGNCITIPAGCCRIDTPLIETCYNLLNPPPSLKDFTTTTAPQFWYNVTLKFTVRLVQAEYYDDTSSAYKVGRVDWNHQLCFPTIGGKAPANFHGMSYYPIGWATSALVVPGFTNFRPLYLPDTLNASGGAWPSGTTVPVAAMPALWLNGFCTND